MVDRADKTAAYFWKVNLAEVKNWRGNFSKTYILIKSIIQVKVWNGLHLHFKLQQNFELFKSKEILNLQ